MTARVCLLTNDSIAGPVDIHSSIYYALQPRVVHLSTARESQLENQRRSVKLDPVSLPLSSRSPRLIYVQAVALGIQRTLIILLHGRRRTSKGALLLRPGRGAGLRCIVINSSLCVSVCLRAYLWNRWTDLNEFFCADDLWPWLGPPLAALRYVMYFRFCGWRHVWPQGPYGDSGVAIPGRSLMSMNTC